MRLVGAIEDGRRQVGVLDDDRVHFLCGLDEFYDQPEARLERAKPLGRPLPVGELAQVPAVPLTSRVLCVGLNYRQHAGETAMAVPESPDVFGRWPSTLTVDGSPVPVPVGHDELDWEGELAVVLGRRLSGASIEESADAILFCCCFNDLTARRYQLAASQWTLGKNADLSAPMGPALVTVDEAGDLSDLPIETRVNGQVMQSANTGEMIFSPAEVLAYASTVMTLLPGDVLATGTPQGVGFTRQPPVLLHPGDHVEVEIGPLGVLRTPIVDRGSR